MTIDRSTEYLLSLLNELRKLPRETEWVEFKHNNAEASRIIKDAVEADLIRCHDETVGCRGRKYLPWWA